MTTLISPPARLETYTLAEDQIERLVAEGILDAGSPALFSVEQYHRIAEAGILGPKDRVFLHEGQLVQKMTVHSRHIAAVTACVRLLDFLLFPGWTVRPQGPVTLATSEPEPDVLVARGRESLYWARNPVAAQTCLLIEVADSSLAVDRDLMARTYAAAGIPVYWIINLVDGQVEVMTHPTATGYADRMDYFPGEAVPVILDGVHVGDLLVDDLLP